MTLQFDPGAYESAFQYGQNRDLQAKQRFADSLNSIPQAFLDYQKGQNQGLMNQLLQGQVKTQTMQNSPLIPPGSQPSSPMPDYGAPQSNLMPNFQPPTQPGQGQMASAGMPDTGWGEGRMAGTPQNGQGGSPIVAAHKQYLASQSGLGSPSTQPPALFSGGSQGNSDPALPFIKALQDPNTSPAQAQALQARIEALHAEEKSPYEIPMMQAGLAKTQSEAQKNLAEAKAAGGVLPEDMIDAQNRNWNGIASRHGGMIPPKIMTAADTVSNQSDLRVQRLADKYQPQIQKYQSAINDIDASIRGIASGDAGQIESAQGIVSTALKLSPRLAKEAGGQSYAAELGEWASGKLGNQSIPPELMKPLINILNLQKNSALTSLNQVKQFAVREGAALKVPADSITALFNPSSQSSVSSSSSNQTKVINGTTYVQQNGKWFQQ